MNTVRFYDPDTKVVIEIPISELAPGCVACRVEGIEGEVFMAASSLKAAKEHRHPPSPTRTTWQYSKTFPRCSRT